MLVKREFIEAYFKSWDEKLERAKTLAYLEDYCYEGVLVLLYHISAFSAMRYPSYEDGVAYKKMLLEYSGMKDLYAQIDLLYLYQWPRSDFKDNGNYKKLKNYDEIKSTLISIYGEEEEIDYDKRFINQDELISHVVNAKIAGFDLENFRSKLPLFSLAEITYRYVRCGAVHNGRLSFINTDADRDCEDGYIITKEILYETAVNIKDNLADECIRLNKWPNEIENAQLE